jgi:hypothetical protein
VVSPITLRSARRRARGRISAVFLFSAVRSRAGVMARASSGVASGPCDPRVSHRRA